MKLAVCKRPASVHFAPTNRRWDRPARALRLSAGRAAELAARAAQRAALKTYRNFSHGAALDSGPRQRYADRAAQLRPQLRSLHHGRSGIRDHHPRHSRGCPLPRPRNWSGPGTPGRPSYTSAAKLTNDPATPTTRSSHANDHPCHQGSSGNWTP
jgi:hypothetical protein